MNPDFFDMLEECLSRGFRVLALSNAMRPMRRAKPRLLDVKNRFGDLLTLRVSLDHFTPERHEDERGPGTFKPTLDGCATSRMIVKRKGSEQPVVVACTLVPYDKQFELGPTLGKAKRSVLLNHPNCARFCVLGGASCSAR